MKTRTVVLGALVLLAVMVSIFVYRVGGIHAYMDYQAARWCSFTSISDVADLIVWAKNDMMNGFHIMFW